MFSSYMWCADGRWCSFKERSRILQHLVRYLPRKEKYSRANVFVLNFNFFMKVIEGGEKWKASIMQNSHVPNNFYLTSSYFRFAGQSGHPDLELTWTKCSRAEWSCLSEFWVLMLVSASFWRKLINIKHQHNALSINTLWVSSACCS